MEWIESKFTDIPPAVALLFLRIAKYMACHASLHEALFFVAAGLGSSTLTPLHSTSTEA